MRKADPELHRRRREEILAAAISCFVRKGFHQSSMQDLATAAGVSMGLLYRYFKNKEAIVEAAAERERAVALEIIAAIPATGDPMSHWTATIMTLVAAAAEPEQMLLINEIVSEAGRAPKLLAILQDYDADLRIAICGRLDVQKGAGSLRAAIDCDGLAHAILLVVDGLTARALSSPDLTEATARLIVRQLLSGILA